MKETRHCSLSEPWPVLQARSMSHSNEPCDSRQHAMYGVVEHGASRVLSCLNANAAIRLLLVFLISDRTVGVPWNRCNDDVKVAGSLNNADLFGGGDVYVVAHIVLDTCPRVVVYATSPTCLPQSEPNPLPRRQRQIPFLVMNE